MSLAFLCVFIFGCSITHLVLLGKEEEGADGKDLTFVDAIRKSPSSIVVVVICFFSVWSIVGLAGFHTYLASSNLTTNEDIKGSYSSKRGHDNFNPFSRGGVFANCLGVLCSPVNPSLIDASGPLTERYLQAYELSDRQSATGSGRQRGSRQQQPQQQQQQHQQQAQASSSSAGYPVQVGSPTATYGAVSEQRNNQVGEERKQRDGGKTY